MKFEPGEGLPGRVYESGKAEWVTDITKDRKNYPRANAYHDIGVRTGFAFPVITAGGVYAVLEFFSTRIREKDELLMTAADTIAKQLGRVVDIQRSREETARLGAAIERINDMVMIVDGEGVIQYVNAAFEKMTGYSRHEAVGSDFHILISGDHDKAFYEYLARTVKSGKSWKGQYVTRTKSGGLLDIEASITPIQDSSGAVTGFIAIKKDITREAMLERHSRRKQKLEAMGMLAGGIAHDFNNILTAVIGYTQLVMENTPKGTETHSDLGEVLTAGKRAKELVAAMLSFSRQAETRKSPLDPAVIVKETLKMLRASIPSTVEVRVSALSGTAQVLADPTQLSQVVMNLCVNAYHAMGEAGGVMEVTLDTVSIDAEEARSLDTRAGEYVKLTVTDTGVGMDEETLERIFDPFFTTKPLGEGTGMGLSTVHGIVREHGGAITVRSAKGEGSTFEVYIPAGGEGQARLEDEEEREDSDPGGAGRILLVDDEESIARMNRKILEANGYEVTPMTSPAVALETFRENPESFDLVITDQTMPGMTGDKLASEIIQIKPSIPVILTTGFSRRITPEKAHAAGICKLLMKPYTAGTLARAAREALAGSRKKNEP
ncbi:MAG: hybrid sensor histidine kinase/response regulator [Candidatus Nitrospinota bacterium M3_3B_026]